MTDGYPWDRGVFNPACVCGGSINRVNRDCERCMMHDWIYKLQAERDAALAKLKEREEAAREIAKHRCWAESPTHDPMPSWLADWPWLEEGNDDA